MTDAKMTLADLQRIEAYCAEASKRFPFPWSTSDVLDNDGGGVVTPDNVIVCGWHICPARSDFIAGASADLPKLVAYAREADALLERCDEFMVKGLHRGKEYIWHGHEFFKPCQCGGCKLIADIRRIRGGASKGMPCGS